MPPPWEFISALRELPPRAPPLEVRIAAEARGRHRQGSRPPPARTAAGASGRCRQGPCRRRASLRRSPASAAPVPASGLAAPEPPLRCPASSIARHRSLRQSPSSDVAKSGFAAGGSLRPSFFEESAEPAYWRNITSRSQPNPTQLHPNNHRDESNPTQFAPTPNQTHRKCSDRL